MSGPLGGDISQRVSAGVGGGVLCVAIRAGPGRGAAGWGGGAGGPCTGDHKCLCHLESPALVRNVRPLRAQIMYWMHPRYF